MNARDEDEWTDIERAAVRALPLEEHVSSTLADRTVAALLGRGLLRRRNRMHTEWIALAAAAALVLFIGGYALGQMRGIHAGHALAIDAMTATPDADATKLAFVLQRTGSAYLRALEVLVAQDSDKAALQAREAALTITEAALGEVTALAPDTATRMRFVQRLQGAAPTHSIWY